MRCKLCTDQVADKTGSHVIPQFLAKYVDCKSGTKNTEIGYKMTPNGHKLYIGRSTLPEQIDKETGEFEESELQKWKIDYIVDYQLCALCESKLGKIESQYAHQTGFNGRINKRAKTNIASIFWISVAWRYYALLEPNQIQQRHLKKLHNALMSHISNETTLQPSRIFWRTFTGPRWESEKYGGFLFISPSKKGTILMIFGSIIVAIYIKSNKINSPVVTPFKLNLNLNSYSINKNHELNEIYHVLTLQEVLSLNDNITKFLVKNEKNKFWKLHVDECKYISTKYRITFKEPQFFNKVWLRFVSNDQIPFARKYEKDRYKELLLKIINENITDPSNL